MKIFAGIIVVLILVLLTTDSVSGTFRDRKFWNCIRESQDFVVDYTGVSTTGQKEVRTALELLKDAGFAARANQCDSHRGEQFKYPPAGCDCSSDVLCDDKSNCTLIFPPPVGCDCWLDYTKLSEYEDLAAACEEANGKIFLANRMSVACEKYESHERYESHESSWYDNLTPGVAIFTSTSENLPLCFGASCTNEEAHRSNYFDYSWATNIRDPGCSFDLPGYVSCDFSGSSDYTISAGSKLMGRHFQKAANAASVGVALVQLLYFGLF